MAESSKTGIGVATTPGRLSRAELKNFVKPTELSMREIQAPDLNSELAKSRILDAVHKHIRDDIGANMADVSFGLDFGLDI